VIKAEADETEEVIANLNPARDELTPKLDSAKE
jgi:hypothetical protein